MKDRYVLALAAALALILTFPVRPSPGGGSSFFLSWGCSPSKQPSNGPTSALPANSRSCTGI